ncbi:MAG: hypothetical protein KF729_30460 [Sandaracinaceae bacterium]|nr:hypothetical protein [Sandaracinaceae bacterium]
MRPTLLLLLAPTILAGCYQASPDPRPCAPQDARGEGACRAVIGVAWDGAACVAISGCECAGADCAALFESVERCEAGYAECLTPPPGECVAQDARGDGLCRLLLGWAFDGEACVTLGGCECLGADCDAVFSSETACAQTYAACVTPAPTPAPCDAQDARGEGACRRLLGVAWDGARCVTVGGCECVGTACSSLFESIEDCELRYAECLAPSPGACEPQDARGDGLCRLALGWVFDGAHCTVASGCECLGADCDALFETEDACLRAYGACVTPEPGACEPQDARGDGLCRLALGWVFDGARCAVASGCECLGADCDALFETEDACLRTYGACVTPEPGGCEPQDARGDGLCRLYLGAAWDGTQCVSLGGCECVGADCGALFESVEACARAYAGCASCAEQELPLGDCRGPTRSYGWRWTGGACEEVVRCSCDGASCDALYASERECRAARAHCPSAGATSCDPNEVWCRALPPTCSAGEVPSVIDHCWGPCVPFAECAPIACGGERLACPEGLRCGGGYCG